MIGNPFRRATLSRFDRIGRGDPRLKNSDLGPGEAFSPTRPQFTVRGLIGREKELTRIKRAICQEHAHIVLFAERGRGKSSLANCVVEQLQRMDWVVARASCDSEIDFDTLIRNLMRSLPASLAAEVPPEPVEGCESLLPRKTLSPRDVAELAGLFGGRQLVLVIEEFDRVADSSVRSLIADAAKQLSDRGAPVAFMIVGVADDAAELIGDNASVHRSVVRVELPLLPDPAVRTILDAGFRISGIAPQPAAVDLIVELAHGTPYIAHLLGLRTFQAVTDAGRNDLSTLDVAVAARQIVQESGSSMRSVLADTSRAKDDEMLSRAVIQIAKGERDAYGRFIAEPGGGGMRVAGKSMEEASWSHLLSAGLVRPVGKPALHTFSFVSSHLEHYVSLRALARDTWMPLPGFEPKLVG